MNHQVSEIRTEQWRRIICECISRDPKISKWQWCQENGIKYRSYMYWQHKFQMEELEKLDSHETMLPAQPDPADALAFVDMTEKLEAFQAEQISVQPQQETEDFVPELIIRTGNCRIYISSSVQESTLNKVMRVLGNA